MDGTLSLKGDCSSIVERVAESCEHTHLAPVTEEENPKVEYAFNWAKKYQPKALKDFICHGEKAEWLQSLVCFSWR